MKLIIESETIVRCAETGKEFAIADLKTIKEKNEIVEDKTKPVIKKTKRVISEFKKLEEE